jgi:ABC-type lipoprotein release transport system permease subunit
MKTMIKLAWRNIWRNRRRTLITAASILFAVMLSTFMMALQKGAWDKMVDNVVNFYYGYAQVHSDGYWEDQSIDKAFPLQEDLIQLGAELDELEQVVPRLESFALASSGNQTSGVLVVGTDPAAEASMTQLQDRLVDGEYFKNGEAATIIGAGVGERLKLDVGDTLVLISQGYHGVNAAGKYPGKRYCQVWLSRVKQTNGLSPAQNSTGFLRS